MNAQSNNLAWPHHLLRWHGLVVQHLQQPCAISRKPYLPHHTDFPTVHIFLFAILALATFTHLVFFVTQRCTNIFPLPRPHDGSLDVSNGYKTHSTRGLYYDRQTIFTRELLYPTNAFVDDESLAPGSAQSESQLNDLCSVLSHQCVLLETTVDDQLGESLGVDVEVGVVEAVPSPWLSKVLSADSLNDRVDLGDRSIAVSGEGLLGCSDEWPVSKGW